MIIEINSKIPQSSIRDLLSHAIFIDKVDSVYERYMQSSSQQLFVKENNIIGCIGIEIISQNCEIKHIAVSPNERGNGIGSKMINFLCKKYSLSHIFAETDTYAVKFYKKFGFKIISLGERYPGVERFLCEINVN